MNIKTLMLIIECWGQKPINTLVEINDDNIDIYTEIIEDGFCGLWIESKKSSEFSINKDKAIHTNIDTNIFNEKLQELNINKWKKIYKPSESEVLDGDQWKLFLIDDNNKEYSYFGTNNCPDEMNKLLELLNIDYEPNNYE